MLAFAVIIDARPTVHLANADPDLAVLHLPQEWVRSSSPR